ncbi:uncharacterized protein PG986_014290 [Apiospora aurea]|uniref:Uncharacterized protein n=1 Tax=Apiospora aurea TaxID=335848 RepID=A0ABR1PSV6_9PEZI
MQSLQGVRPSSSPLLPSHRRRGRLVQALALAAPRLAVVAAELGALPLVDWDASFRLQLFAPLRGLLVGESAWRAARGCHVAAAAMAVLGFELREGASGVHGRREAVLSQLDVALGGIEFRLWLGHPSRGE